MKPDAEKIRLRYLYRQKILNGELVVSHRTARRMIGPDCAYHLYGKHTEPKAQRPKAKGKKERDEG